MTLPPGGGKPGHIRETLKLHPHSHFLDASKERSLTAALKNKERSEAEGTVNVRDHRITGGLFCLLCMSLNFVVKVQCGNGSGGSDAAVIGIIVILLTVPSMSPENMEEGAG